MLKETYSQHKHERGIAMKKIEAFLEELFESYAHIIEY